MTVASRNQRWGRDGTSRGGAAGRGLRRRSSGGRCGRGWCCGYVLHSPRCALQVMNHERIDDGMGPGCYYTWVKGGMLPRDVMMGDAQSRIEKSGEGIGSSGAAKEEVKGENDDSMMTRDAAGIGRVCVEVIQHVALRRKVVTSGSMGHMEPQRRVSKKTLCDYLSKRRKKKDLVEWFPRIRGGNGAIINRANGQSHKRRTRARGEHGEGEGLEHQKKRGGWVCPCECVDIMGR